MLWQTMKLFCLEAAFHRCFGFGRRVAGSCLSISLEPRRLFLNLLSGVLTEKGDELSRLLETASFELDLDMKHLHNRQV